MKQKTETTSFLPIERPVLTRTRLERLSKLHTEWWQTGHGENPVAYSKAKDKCFAAAMEYLPELIDVYRKSARLADLEK